jgi:hypothetical protein
MSPALYPAIDPSSHDDVEDASDMELTETVPSDENAPELDSEEDQDVDYNPDDEDHPWFIDKFREAELLQQPEDLQHIRNESYSDALNLPVISIWDTRWSKSRPSFSITLYTSFDMPPVHPEALFSCLSKGMISTVPWTLDMVQNIPSLDAAFQYHARASELRKPERTARRRLCMDMVLNKILAPRLPKELVEIVEELLSPPVIPNYCCLPHRPFQDVFLYIEQCKLRTGPLIVYSNPRTFSSEHGDRKIGSMSDEPPEAPPMPEHMSWDKKGVLEVSALQSWHRVANDIHILWCYHGPSSVDDDLSKGNPALTLKVEFIERHALHKKSQDDIFPGGLQLTLYASQPIAAYREHMFSHSLLDEAFYLVDLDTGVAFNPDWPSWGAELGRSLSTRGWQHTRDLAYSGRRRSRYNPRNFLTTLEPGSIQLETPSGWTMFWSRIGSTLRDGGRYALKLRPGVTLQTWTWGTATELKGPFNLPPIPVVLQPTEFIFAGSASPGCSRWFIHA